MRIYFCKPTMTRRNSIVGDAVGVGYSEFWMSDITHRN